MGKHVLITYILWLFAGCWGIHLFYLGRDRHALVWFITAGGVFGMGWLRDFFRIPEYVDEANDYEEYREYTKRRQRVWKRPQFSSVRFVGELTVGMLFGFLIRSAIPPEYFEIPTYGKYLELLTPIAVAAGVHLVGCIGQETVSLKTAYGAACLPLFLVWFASDITDSSRTFASSSLFSAVMVNFIGKKWKPRQKQRHVCYRFMVLSLAASVYTGVWASVLLHNAYVTTSDGHKVRMREAVENFFNSPAWENMKDSTAHVFNTFFSDGFRSAYDEMLILIDPEGETNAYKVMGLNRSATQQEITSAYRSLVKKWHPDRHKEEEAKKQAETEFMKIQKAYEKISEIHSRRAESKGGQSSSSFWENAFMAESLNNLKVKLDKMAEELKAKHSSPSKKGKKKATNANDEF